MLLLPPQPRSHRTHQRLHNYNIKKHLLTSKNRYNRKIKNGLVGTILNIINNLQALDPFSAISNQVPIFLLSESDLMIIKFSLFFSPFFILYFDGGRSKPVGPPPPESGKKRKDSTLYTIKTKRNATNGSYKYTYIHICRTRSAASAIC